MLLAFGCRSDPAAATGVESSDATDSTSTGHLATTVSAEESSGDVTTDADASTSASGSDGGESSSTTGAGNEAPVAADDAYQVVMDEPSLVVDAAEGVLANDSDIDGDALQIVAEPGLVADSGAMVDLHADGSFTYTPLASWWGEDAFAYTVADSHDAHAQGSVRIVVSPTAIPLGEVAAGTGGFVIEGSGFERSGIAVDGVGDVDGDGHDDVIVGAQYGGPSGTVTGRAYVVLGKSDGTAVALTDVAEGTGGFVIDGDVEGDRAGHSVSGAGDVNGDGSPDLVIGVPGPQTVGAGRAFVVFGKDDGASVALVDVGLGEGGFAIAGASDGDQLGLAVSGAGDVNGDGLDDVIVGAEGSDPNGTNSGRAYVVFGKASTAAVSVTDLVAGDGGFVIDGELAGEFAGNAVGGGGDVNGDGLSDLVVGASGYGGNVGRAAVVFGKASGDAVAIADVAGGIGGFTIDGDEPFGVLGGSAAIAGDVDDDGLDDVVVGAFLAHAGDDGAGRGYVVFGKLDGDAVSASAIRGGRGGFTVDGVALNEQLSGAVAGTGDVDGDGAADLIFGARYFDMQAGRAYFVLGNSGGAAISATEIADGVGGYVLDGESVADGAGNAVGDAGDVNGDGVPDLIVGASNASGGAGAGRSYIIFGGDFSL